MKINAARIKNDRIEHLKSIISIMPETPGVYQYFNKEGEIIYVGKAKCLKRRVSSYFNKVHDSNRTNRLVRNIHDLKYIVVNTEEDALKLENYMIKAHQPRYNVLLKDDKTYPYICIKNEPFPRVMMTRKVIKDGSLYFGPYTNLKVAYALLELFRQIYKVRTCNLNLNNDNINSHKYKVCLQYHIKNCKGPCEGRVTHEEYDKDVAEIKQILQGHTKDVLDFLYNEMMVYASKLKFEEAEEIKHKHRIIENYHIKTSIVQPVITNVDVYSYSEEENSAYINYFHIIKGAIIQSYSFEYKRRIDEPKEEILALGISEMRERFNSPAKEIIVPFVPEMNIEGVTFTVPQRGEKKKLLDLSDKNLKQFLIDKLKQAEKLDPEQRSIRLMKEIQKELSLEKMPMHIECFDNSNISGSDAVAACVVFKKAMPVKQEYRKYNIKSVVGPDDYASMKEVVKRRYSRLIEEGSPLPDLIIADGGKGQMEVIRQVVEDELNLKIPIAGLAKDSRHRTSELLFGFPQKVIGIKPQSQLFRLMEQIQNEVHRFAITFHKDKRSKRQIASALDSIKGIGDKTKEMLLKEFKSIKRIKEANPEDIEKVIGKAKAKILLDSFSKDQAKINN
ncbi:MAG: excinuclease ABC subunit UvrC [Bacteroidales bacterium]|nr:excinuclease ABC subunit UvrC [Bacteroidales bacterium]